MKLEMELEVVKVRHSARTPATSEAAAICHQLAAVVMPTLVTRQLRGVERGKVAATARREST